MATVCFFGLFVNILFYNFALADNSLCFSLRSSLFHHFLLTSETLPEFRFLKFIIILVLLVIYAVIQILYKLHGIAFFHRPYSVPQHRFPLSRSASFCRMPCFFRFDKITALAGYFGQIAEYLLSVGVIEAVKSVLSFALLADKYLTFTVFYLVEKLHVTEILIRYSLIYGYVMLRRCYQSPEYKPTFLLQIPCGWT